VNNYSEEKARNKRKDLQKRREVERKGKTLVSIFKLSIKI